MELAIVTEELGKAEQQEQQLNVKVNESRKQRDNANAEKKKADSIAKKLGIYLKFCFYYLTHSCRIERTTISSIRKRGRHNKGRKYTQS